MKKALLYVHEKGGSSKETEQIIPVYSQRNLRNKDKEIK